MNVGDWKPRSRERREEGVHLGHLDHLGHLGHLDHLGPASSLGEAPVAEDALLLLHGAAEDDPDGEDEDSQGHSQGRVVVLQLSSTVCTVGPAINIHQT